MAARSPAHHTGMLQRTESCGRAAEVVCWLGQPGEGCRVSLPSVGDDAGLVGALSMGWCREVHLSLQIGHRLFRGRKKKKKKVTVPAMTEPGENVVIKAVAAGVKYDPACSPMGMRARGVALLKKSKYLHFSTSSGLHAHCSGEGTHYWDTPL